MATVSHPTVGPADEAEEVKGADVEGGDDSPPPLVEDNDDNSQGVTPTVGQGENWEKEMEIYNRTPIEPCVKCIATDETTTNWTSSKHNYSLPLSSSVTDLHSAFAKETGYVEGTFLLIWRKQNVDGPTEEEEELYWKSTATLNEIGMESEPKKMYLLIREKDGKPPEKVETTSSTVTSSTGSKATSTAMNNTTQWGGTTSSYGSSSYGYSSYSYNYSYKSETGFVGLVNQAMTCYLNSLLQTLFMTPEFRNALYNWEFTRNNGDEGIKSIPFQLQRLFVQLQTSDKRAVETTDVTKSFGWDSSEAWQQHDVQELCRVMFDALEKRFKKDRHPEQDLINLLYQGKTLDYVKCLECGLESTREDHFLDIPLVIKPFGSNKSYSSVEEALRNHVQPETLSGDNQYKCAKCDKLCDAHKGLRFRTFPYLLTLQLKRFDFDYSTMHRIKLNDRMTFPRILDLNEFADPEEMPEMPPDVEEQYRDFVVERFDPKPPPYYGYSNYSHSSSSHSQSYNVQNSAHSAQSHTSNVTSHDQSHDLSQDQTVADANNESDDTQQEEASSRELTVGQRLAKGPYVYELFSIMIHSGSAIGGHYYAYIKSFTDKKWYCFNDQSVTRLNEEDIEGTFGGSDSRSRGYYSSVYSSSANAYMLMYRRIDKERNKDFITDKDLPLHLLLQIAEDRKAQEEEKKRQEMERSLCKFRLFSRHPVSGESLEKRIEVHQDWTLQRTVEEARKLLQLQDVVPLSRCRLVKYDEYTETLDQSFEEKEDQTFGQMVGGPRNYYAFELFLEIKEEGETFRVYNRGGLNLKVLVVDLAVGEVRPAVPLRAEQGWKVAELKEAIAEKLHLPVDCMNLALETYQSEGKHLPQPNQLLKNEGFFRKHSVFVCCDPEDIKKPFKESEMCKLIDRHVNSILLFITIPPPPKRRVTDHADSAIKAPTTEQAVGDGDGGTGDSEGVRGEGEGGEEGGGDDGERGRDKSEGEGEGSSVDVQVTVAVKGEDGDVGRVNGEEVEGTGKGEGEEEEEEEVRVKSKLEGVVDLTKDRPLQRTIELRIDRRSTLGDLKQKLEEHVQQPSSNFKIYRLYSNNQEYEMFRVNDALTTVPNETKMIVRLGRALKTGEIRVRLSLLRMREVDFFKPLMDSIITRGMTVKEFKKQLIQEAYDQGVEYPLQLDRIRLRKKTWRSPVTVFLDDQVFEKDIHVFANFEMYVEPLDGPEPMTCPTQMQVYLRRWHPSTYTVDPVHEIVLLENTPEHLRNRIAVASGIPIEHVSFAKAYGSFPCEVSVLDIEEDMDWNPNVSTISSMPLSIYDDGAVLYYKDTREKLMELTPEKRSEIQKQERTKSNSHSSYTYRYHTKEKALKIYTDDDDQPNNGSKEG